MKTFQQRPGIGHVASIPAYSGGRGANHNPYLDESLPVGTSLSRRSFRLRARAWSGRAGERRSVPVAGVQYAGAVGRFRIDDASALIHAARLDAELTQAQLAQRAGLSQSILVQLEFGTRAVPDELLERVLRAADYRPSLPLTMQADEIIACAGSHGLSNPHVFGSSVRGEDDFDSDIDLLVTPSTGTDLFDLALFVDDVERLIGFPTNEVSDAQDGHPSAWQAPSDPAPDGRTVAGSRRRDGTALDPRGARDRRRRRGSRRAGRGGAVLEGVAIRGSFVLVPVLVTTALLLVIVTCRTAVDAHAEGFQPAILLRIAVVLGCLALAWPAVLLALATSAPALDVRWRSGRRAGAGVPIRVRRGRRWPCGRGRPGSLRGPAGAWSRTSGPRRSPRAQASRAPIAGAPSVKGARPRSLYHLAARRRVSWLVSERTAPETTAKATTSPSR